MSDYSELTFAKAVYKVSVAVGDTPDDEDKYPDLAGVSGTWILRPKVNRILLTQADVPETVIPSEIKGTFVDGMLTYNGDPFIWLPLAQRLPGNLALFLWEFSGEYRYGGSIRIRDQFTFDLVSGTEENPANITTLRPLENITGELVTKGDPGRGYTGVTISGNSLVFSASELPMTETVTVPALVAAESNANAAEVARAAAVVARTGAETARTGAETARAGAEVAQAGAESVETDMYAARDAAITAKNAAELAETNAETAETGAVTARTGAETARAAAELAESNAEIAQSLAETAADDAEIARAAAVVAKDGAEAARVGVDTAETNSAASAAAALASENAAATAKTNAETAQGLAQTAATNAETARAAAVTAKNAAETAQGLAETAAGNAETARAAAVTAKNAAETAATNAENSRIAADAAKAGAETARTGSEVAQGLSEDARDTATLKATEASDSADAAAQSAQDAEDTVGTGIPNATDSTKGGILLPGGAAGELGGTFDHPTVAGWSDLAPKASPTFTGTVSGVTKAHVGLGNVDNTADSAKPVSTAQQTALDSAIAAGQRVSVRVISTSGPIVLADASNVVESTSASAMNITVPLNSSVAFPVGTVIELLQVGVGQITVVPTGGVTINSAASLISRAQWSNLALRKRATDTWILTGDMQ